MLGIKGKVAETSNVRLLSIEGMGEGCGVDTSKRMAMNLYAVIKAHGILGEDESLERSPTVRELVQKYEHRCHGLLQDYVCAFGKYGLEVLKRFLEREGVDISDLEEKADKVADMYVKDYKASVQKKAESV